MTARREHEHQRGAPTPSRSPVVLAALVVVTGAVLVAGGTWFAPAGGPAPRPPASSRPLGTAPPVTEGTASHAFLALQPGGTDPVRYDPCRPVAYVVNPRTAPVDSALVADAVAEISDATGLRFHDEGVTDEAPSEERPAFQRERYGDRWAPVLIAWSDPAEVAALDGDVAGIGGSTRVVAPGGGDEVYVTGLVVLDGPQLARLVAAGRRRHVQAVVLHELAHVVGLDHVDDARELLYSGHGRTWALGAGDRAGLAALGRGRCFPLL